MVISSRVCLCVFSKKYTHTHILLLDRGPLGFLVAGLRRPRLPLAVFTLFGLLAFLGSLTMLLFIAAGGDNDSPFPVINLVTPRSYDLLHVVVLIILFLDAFTHVFTALDSDLFDQGMVLQGVSPLLDGAVAVSTLGDDAIVLRRTLLGTRHIMLFNPLQCGGVFQWGIVTITYIQGRFTTKTRAFDHRTRAQSGHEHRCEEHGFLGETKSVSDDRHDGCVVVCLVGSR